MEQEIVDALIGIRTGLSVLSITVSVNLLGLIFATLRGKQ